MGRPGELRRGAVRYSVMPRSLTKQLSNQDSVLFASQPPRKFDRLGNPYLVHIIPQNAVTPQEQQPRRFSPPFVPGLDQPPTPEDDAHQRGGGTVLTAQEA